MFERFTDEARRAIVLAQEEARSLNHNYLGTEHLLLGLLLTDGIAAGALRAVGIDLQQARNQIEEIIGVGHDGPAVHVPFTPRAKKVLELSQREAQQLGHGYIGTEHLLLGLLREGDGVGTQVLTRAGIELSELRAEIASQLGRSPGDVAGGFVGVTVTAGQTGSAVGILGVEEPVPQPPVCPRCRRSFRENAAYRVLDVPEDGGSGTARTLFVFCEACGETLGVKVLDS